MVPGQPFGFSAELWQPTPGLAPKPGGMWMLLFWQGNSTKVCPPHCFHLLGGCYCFLLPAWLWSMMKTMEEVGGRLLGDPELYAE